MQRIIRITMDVSIVQNRFTIFICATRTKIKCTPTLSSVLRSQKVTKIDGIVNVCELVNINRLRIDVRVPYAYMKEHRPIGQHHDNN